LAAPTAAVIETEEGVTRVAQTASLQLKPASIVLLHCCSSKLLLMLLLHRGAYRKHTPADVTADVFHVAAVQVILLLLLLLPHLQRTNAAAAV
jgi:hypothetical protein